ncbi:MAG: flagellar hook-length control protein FliK [Burkholderiaceae bacterium]
MTTTPKTSSGAIDVISGGKGAAKPPHRKHTVASDFAEALEAQVTIDGGAAQSQEASASSEHAARKAGKKNVLSPPVTHDPILVDAPNGPVLPDAHGSSALDGASVTVQSPSPGGKTRLHAALTGVDRGAAAAAAATNKLSTQTATGGPVTPAAAGQDTGELTASSLTSAADAPAHTGTSAPPGVKSANAGQVSSAGTSAAPEPMARTAALAASDLQGATTVRRSPASADAGISGNADVDQPAVSSALSTGPASPQITTKADTTTAADAGRSPPAAAWKANPVDAAAAPVSGFQSAPVSGEPALALTHPVDAASAGEAPVPSQAAPRPSATPAIVAADTTRPTVELAGRATPGKPAITPPGGTAAQAATQAVIAEDAGVPATRPGPGRAAKSGDSSTREGIMAPVTGAAIVPNERTAVREPILASSPSAAAAGSIDAGGPLGEAVAHMTAAENEALVPAADDGFAAMLNEPIDLTQDIEQLGGQLGERVSMAISRGLERADIQVRPEGMGPIRIEIAMQGGEAHVQFHAAHADTRALLNDSGDTLRGMLEQRGIQLGSTSVGTGSGNGTGTGNGNGTFSSQPETRPGSPWRNTPEPAGGPGDATLSHLQQGTGAARIAGSVDLFA